MKTKTLPINLDLSKCSDFFLRRGFYIHEENDFELTMIKPGSIWTMKFTNTPLKLSFTKIGGQTKISLEYNVSSFILDTGDLKRELERICAMICNNTNFILDH